MLIIYMKTLVVGQMHFFLTVGLPATTLVLGGTFATLTDCVRHQWAAVKVSPLPIDDFAIEMAFSEGVGPQGGRAVSLLAEGAA